MSKGRFGTLGVAVAGISCFVFHSRLHGDDGLLLYEGDVTPYSPEGGWIVADACGGCLEYIEDGHYVTDFTVGYGNMYNYHHWLSMPPEPQPSSLFVECRMRTSAMWQPPEWFGNDSRLTAHFDGVHDTIYMQGNVVVNDSGNFAVTGLAPTDFRVYRFESFDGHHWTWAVDGLTFYSNFYLREGNGYAYVQFGAAGNITAINEWDYIRYGTLSFGELVESTDPPNGYLDPRQDRPPFLPQELQGLDRFTVTFDQANGLNIDQITVESTAPTALRPAVSWVTRPEGADGRTFLVILDKRIPPGHRTRFIISDEPQAAEYGQTGATYVVEYAFLPGDVNADETANTQDVLALIQGLNNCASAGTCASPVLLAQYDINRSGSVNTQDLLRTVQLLNGTQTQQLWNGVSLPPWP